MDRGLRSRNLAIALLGVLWVTFEVGVARTDWGRDWALEETQVGTLQRYVIARGIPWVVVFGNSRTLYGVDERQLAAKLGLPASHVMKLAMNSGSLADYAWLYSAHRATLRSARLVVVAVDDWDVAVMPTVRAREDIYGVAIGDLIHHDPRAWPVLLTIAASHSTALLRPVGRTAASWLLHKERDRSPGGTPDAGLLGECDPETEAKWRAGEWTVPETWHAKGKMPPALRWPVQTINDRHCRGRLTSLAPLPELFRLISMMESDGVSVVVTRLPLTDRYFDDLLARYPRFATQSDRAFQIIESYAAAHRRVRAHIMGRASDLGLDDRAFYDYGHPSPLGRERITNLVVEWASEQAVDGL